MRRADESVDLPTPKALHEVLTEYPTLTQWGDDVEGPAVDPIEFARACSFLQALAYPTAKINGCRSVSALKHDAEAWIGEPVSVGAFLAAALALGFLQEQVGGAGNAHCFLNLRIGRQARPVSASLHGDGLDQRALVTLAHRVSARLGVPFLRLWNVLSPGMPGSPIFAALEMALGIDAVLKNAPGTFLRAYGQALQKEAAR